MEKHILWDGPPVHEITINNAKFSHILAEGTSVLAVCVDGNLCYHQGIPMNGRAAAHKVDKYVILVCNGMIDKIMIHNYFLT